MYLKSIDNTQIVPIFEPPRVIYYSKDLTSFRVYNCLQQVMEDFKKDNLLVACMELYFRYTSPLFVTNNVNDIKSFDIVVFDCTINLSEFINSIPELIGISLNDNFKKINFINNCEI
jgi:hypothetical protein